MKSFMNQIGIAISVLLTLNWVTRCNLQKFVTVQDWLIDDPSQRPLHEDLFDINKQEFSQTSQYFQRVLKRVERIFGVIYDNPDKSTVKDYINFLQDITFNLRDLVLKRMRYDRNIMTEERLIQEIYLIRDKLEAAFNEKTLFLSKQKQAKVEMQSYNRKMEVLQFFYQFSKSKETQENLLILKLALENVLYKQEEIGKKLPEKLKSEEGKYNFLGKYFNLSFGFEQIAIKNLIIKNLKSIKSAIEELETIKNITPEQKQSQFQEINPTLKEIIDLINKLQNDDEKKIDLPQITQIMNRHILLGKISKFALSCSQKIENLVDNNETITDLQELKQQVNQFLDLEEKGGFEGLIDKTLIYLKEKIDEQNISLSKETNSQIDEIENKISSIQKELGDLNENYNNQAKQMSIQLKQKKQTFINQLNVLKQDIFKLEEQEKIDIIEKEIKLIKTQSNKGSFKNSLDLVYQQLNIIEKQFYQNEENKLFELLGRVHALIEIYFNNLMKEQNIEGCLQNELQVVQKQIMILEKQQTELFQNYFKQENIIDKAFQDIQDKLDQYIEFIGMLSMKWFADQKYPIYGYQEVDSKLLLGLNEILTQVGKIVDNNEKIYDEYFIKLDNQRKEFFLIISQIYDYNFLNGPLSLIIITLQNLNIRLFEGPELIDGQPNELNNFYYKGRLEENSTINYDDHFNAIYNGLVKILIEAGKHVMDPSYQKIPTSFKLKIPIQETGEKNVFQSCYKIISMEQMVKKQENESQPEEKNLMKKTEEGPSKDQIQISQQKDMQNKFEDLIKQKDEDEESEVSSKEYMKKYRALEFQKEFIGETLKVWQRTTPENDYNIPGRQLIAEKLFDFIDKFQELKLFERKDLIETIRRIIIQTGDSYIGKMDKQQEKLFINLSQDLLKMFLYPNENIKTGEQSKPNIKLEHEQAQTATGNELHLEDEPIMYDPRLNQVSFYVIIIGKFACGSNEQYKKNFGECQKVFNYVLDNLPIFSNIDPFVWKNFKFYFYFLNNEQDLIKNKSLHQLSLFYYIVNLVTDPVDDLTEITDPAKFLTKFISQLSYPIPNLRFQEFAADVFLPNKLTMIHDLIKCLHLMNPKANFKKEDWIANTAKFEKESQLRSLQRLDGFKDFLTSPEGKKALEVLHRLVINFIRKYPNSKLKEKLVNDKYKNMDIYITFLRKYIISNEDYFNVMTDEPVIIPEANKANTENQNAPQVPQVVPVPVAPEAQISNDPNQNQGKQRLLDEL